MEFKKGSTTLLSLTSDSLRQFDKDLARIFTDLFTMLGNMFDRGLTFSENMDCKLVSFTSNGVADTEDTVAHNLGKVPTGYLIYSIDKACSVYLGGTAATATNIYLKTSAATVAVKIIVF